MHRTKKRKGAFRPRLEALENRWCPSCDISVIDGHILQILGDETANSIEVRQTSDGMTEVSCDGETASFRGINTFDIATGAGNDFVTANFQTPPEPDFNFRADLGADDDSFTANFVPTETTPAAPTDLPPGPCRINVFGQQGNDRMSLFLGGPDTGPEPHLFNAALSVNLDGGLGNDSALIDITNVVVNGPLSLSCNGGFGDDVMGWDWRDVTVNAPMSLTTNLGGGNDIAALNAYNVAFNADAVTSFMGGGGADSIAQTWWATPVAPGASLAVNTDAGDGGDTVGIVIEGGNVATGGSLAVNADAGAGDDQVNVTLLDILSDMAFRVHLGAGDDTFQGNVAIANLGGASGPAPMQVDPGNFSVSIDVLGRAGDDVLGLQVGGPGSSPEAFWLNSDLSVNLDGGLGNNRALIDITNVAVNGSVMVHAEGGAGADTGSIIMEGGTVAPGAVLDIALSGGRGGDALSIGGFCPCLLPGSRGHIALAGDGGNDTIDATLQFRDDVGGLVSFAFTGGLGDDRIQGDIMPCLLPGGELDVTLAGDEGNDTIAATLREAHVDGQFNLNLTGGAGADDLFIGGFCPCESPEARSSIRVAGDGGNDVIRGDLRLDPDSRGLIDIIFEGGLGDDDLTLSISGLGGPDTFEALVDGGDGYDVARVTRGMLVENCEEVFILE